MKMYFAAEDEVEGGLLLECAGIISACLGCSVLYSL